MARVTVGGPAFRFGGLPTDGLPGLPEDGVWAVGSSAHPAGAERVPTSSH